MPSRHDHLINTLFKTDEDRAFARAFVGRYEREPMMADRIEPLLREAASANQRVAAGEITAEQGRDYLGSFAREAIGTPEHLVTSGMDWLFAGGRDPGEISDEKLAGMSPEMRQIISEHDRAKAKEDVGKFERMMRENPSEYWRPENQQAYRLALERSLPPQAQKPEAREPTAAEDVRAAVLGTAAPTAPLAGSTAPIAPSPAAAPTGP
jgi:hypothetical protein